MQKPARDIPSPFRDGFRPSANTQKPTLAGRDEYGGRYSGDPGRGMSADEKFGETPVQPPPSPVKNLRGR